MVVDGIVAYDDEYNDDAAAGAAAIKELEFDAEVEPNV
jgi:hypothetical protein